MKNYPINKTELSSITKSLKCNLKLDDITFKSPTMIFRVKLLRFHIKYLNNKISNNKGDLYSQTSVSV